MTMLNSAVAADELLARTPNKESGYSGLELHDYVVNGELTVTITLAEYRALVQAQAKAERLDALARASEKTRENDKLKEELAAVKKQLEEFRALIQGAAKKEGAGNEQ